VDDLVQDGTVHFLPSTKWSTAARAAGAQFGFLRSRSTSAVAEAAAAEGLAGVELVDIVQLVQDAMWQPEYCRIQAS
jgi:hypothetical protein